MSVQESSNDEIEAACVEFHRRLQNKGRVRYEWDAMQPSYRDRMRDTMRFAASHFTGPTVRLLGALSEAETLLDAVDTDEGNYNGLGELADAAYKGLDLIREAAGIREAVSS